MTATLARDAATRVPPAWRYGAAAAGVWLAAQVAGRDDGPGLCLFRGCTGGYCPGCGASRATRHLSTGQIGAAWRDHPWIVLVALQLAVAGAVVAVARWSGRHLDWRAHTGRVVALNLALVMTVWVARLALGDIPRFWE